MRINIDPESSTFGKAAGFVLSEENRYLMYIPNTYTYAHGFTVLEDNTELEYLTDNEYSYSDAKSIWYADDSLTVINTKELVQSCNHSFLAAFALVAFFCIKS